MIINKNPISTVFSAVSFFLGPDRARYLTHVPIVLVSEAGELLPPFLAGVLITLLIDLKPGDDLSTLVLLIIALAASRGLVAWIRLRSKRILGQVALNCRYRARVWGFERLVGFSMSWHHKEAAGNKVQRLITGSDAVRDWTNFHNDVASPFSSIVGVIIACAFISPYFIVFAAYFVIGMLLIERFYDSRIAELSAVINSGNENASGAIIEGATNMLTIKAAGAGAMVRNTVEKREANATALGHQRVALNAKKWLVFQLHTGIAFGIFLSAVAWATLNHVIAVGFVVTYIQYFNGLRSATNAFTDKFQSMVERYAELLRFMPLFSDVVVARDKAVPTDWNEIRVRNLHYSWGDKEALCDINFRILRGDKIGITGQSGSGKSSLIKIILGLYLPSRGAVEIGGVAVQEIAENSLEKHVAVVLQEVELFNLSIKENITLMRDFDKSLFERVCAAAGLEAVLGRLPEGEMTILGDRGHALSGGERQRVGIARALYRIPQILVLDEATSALDDQTELRVMQGILEFMPDDAVVIAVAHRERSLAQMTRVLNFDAGTVEELVGEREREQ